MSDSNGWKHGVQMLPGILLLGLYFKRTVYNFYFHFSSSGWPQDAAWVGLWLFHPVTLALQKQGRLVQRDKQKQDT